MRFLADPRVPLPIKLLAGVHFAWGIVAALAVVISGVTGALAHL